MPFWLARPRLRSPPASTPGDVADAGVAHAGASMRATRQGAPRGCRTRRGASRSIRTRRVANGAASKTAPARVAASAASGPCPRPSATSTAQSPSRSAIRQVSPQTCSRGAGIADGADRSAGRRGGRPARAADAGATRSRCRCRASSARRSRRTAAAPRPARCPACRRSNSRPAGTAARRPSPGPASTDRISMVGPSDRSSAWISKRPRARAGRGSWPARWRRSPPRPRSVLVEADRLGHPRWRRGAPRRPGSASETATATCGASVTSTA